MSGRPASPQEVRKGIEHYSAEEVGDLFTIGQKGSIVGSLDKACGSKIGRYEVLMFLFPDKWENLDNVSSKTLTNSEWWALYRWLRPYKDEHLDRWTYEQHCNEEVRWILDFIERDKEKPIQSIAEAELARENEAGASQEGLST